MTLILTSNKTATASVGNLYGVDGPSDYSALLDFERGFYRVEEGGKVNVSKADAIEAFRSGSGSYFDDNGALQTLGALTARIGVTQGNEGRLAAGLRGLISEPAVTNYLLNSTAPVTQTRTLAAGTYTLSVYGSGSAAATGASITSGDGEVATHGVPVTIVNGSTDDVTITVAGTLDAFQLENSSTPTSIIVTSGAQAGRSYDRFALTPRFFDALNLAEGTVIVDFTPYKGYTSTGFLARYSAASANPNMQFQYQNGNRVYAGVQAVGGASQVSRSNPLTTANGPLKFAFAFKENDYAMQAKGGKIFSDTNGHVPTGITKFEIGASGFSTSVFTAGIFRKLVFYNRRLSDTEITAALA